MLFHTLHEGTTSLAYVCLGADEAMDAVHHTRSLFRGYGVLHMY